MSRPRIPSSEVSQPLPMPLPTSSSADLVDQQNDVSEIPWHQDIDEGPWYEMSERLYPMLGDLNALLGQRWHMVLDTLFTSHDLEVAHALLTRRVSRRTWFIITFHDSDESNVDFGEGNECLAAESEAQAIAFLRSWCARLQVLPDKVTHDRPTRTTKLFYEGICVATVSPATLRSVDPSHSQRAKSALCGLRDGQRLAEEELAKRLSEWPYMQTIRTRSRRDDGELQDTTHLSVPKEWISSARELCRLCGRPTEASSFLQEVAAVALKAPSWNHLAAGAEDKLLHWMPPWMMSARASNELTLYKSPYDAVADCLMRLPRQLASNWSAIELGYGYSLGGTPALHFFEPKEDPFAWVENAIWVRQVQRCAEIDASGNATESALVALEHGEAGLADLFCVALNVDQRASILDSESDEDLIAQDGPWRFTVSRDGTPTSRFVFARRIRADGSCTFRAGVPLYKGQLRFDEVTGFHLLCSDYDGRSPVALLDGLSDKTVASVQAFLPASRNAYCAVKYDEHSVGYLHERDVRAYQRLLAQAKAWARVGVLR